MIKLFQPFVSEQAKILCREVLDSNYLTEGEQVKMFEDEFATKFNLTNVVAVNSGTSALELAYELAGIKEGDEVITPVFTCTATNIPLLHLKAKIVFADTDYDLNINIEDVKNKITEKTKAIVFVHFGGNNRGLKEIQQICKDKGLVCIEDCAQAVGSDYWGNSDFACVSTQAIKTLTSGDGGFLICKSDDSYKRAKRLRWFGFDREEKQRVGNIDVVDVGYKKHMNNISAAIGRGNLMVIDELINHRKKLAEIYKLYGLISYAWLTGGFCSHYKDFKDDMAEAGYEIGQAHYRNDSYTIFKEYKNNCPVMDTIEKTYFFVPYHHGVTEEDAHKIGKLCQQLK